MFGRRKKRSSLSYPAKESKICLDDDSTSHALRKNKNFQWCWIYVNLKMCLRSETPPGEHSFLFSLVDVMQNVRTECFPLFIPGSITQFFMPMKTPLECVHLFRDYLAFLPTWKFNQFMQSSVGNLNEMVAMLFVEVFRWKLLWLMRLALGGFWLISLWTADVFWESKLKTCGGLNDVVVRFLMNWLLLSYEIFFEKITEKSLKIFKLQSH